MMVNNISFTVTFAYGSKVFTASYALTLPEHKRPTYDHVSIETNKIRGLCIRIKSLDDIDGIHDISISDASPSSIYCGLYDMTSYCSDTNTCTYNILDNFNVGDDDGDDSGDDDGDDVGVAYRFAKSIRFNFTLDKDPHSGCYCKTQRVCGCGCDRDHAGW